jgi:hypothetical protein
MKPATPHPKLNLPPCRLKVAERGNELCVWDAIRGRWLVLTPEEWVRRHVLAMLTGGAGGAGDTAGSGGAAGAAVPPTSIAQEYLVNVNGQPQRADIVVFDSGARPVLVVECKAPEVKIDQRTLAQAFRYNAVLGARYVMLTNGLAHYLYEVSPAGKYIPLKTFPTLTGTAQKTRL